MRESGLDGLLGNGVLWGYVHHPVRVLVDGMTAANDLGLTDAVPAQVVVHTDGRLRPIQLDNLTIHFQITAASKLYWAGRPSMRIVQALHWLRDGLSQNQDRVSTRLLRLLQTNDHDGIIRNDLQQGWHTLPAWMQNFMRPGVTKMKPCLSGSLPIKS